jgi:hypothetical protein
MQVLRMSGAARTALNDLVFLATAHGIAALAATRIVESGRQERQARRWR